jgi:hypothetical protein
MGNAVSGAAGKASLPDIFAAPDGALGGGPVVTSRHSTQATFTHLT